MTARRKQRKKVSEQKIVGALDMPKILSPSVPHIEMEGNKEAVVDGCFGITEYDDDRISLSQSYSGDIACCTSDGRLYSSA